MARVRRVLETIASQHEAQTVVACCHGGVIWGSLTLLLGEGPLQASADADFTSITEWRFGADRWHLVRFNDTAHLVKADLLVR